MLTEPDDLDRAELKAFLERHWGVRRPELEYLPVGFGGHHWLAVDPVGERRFVTVDDLDAGFQAGPDADSAFAALDRAYRTAAALRDDAQLDFVVAPLFDREGAIIRRLTDRYAVTLLPFVEGTSAAFGPYESSADRRSMCRVLGRLHAATDLVPRGLPRREDFALPSRAALLDALADLDRPWETGPFAERARRLLRAKAPVLEDRLRRYDELVARIRGDSAQWVVTHGEPHRANVIRGHGGGAHLVDWDTTLIAPRERDLQMVLDERLTGWDEYAAVAGDVSLDHAAVRLYRSWWELADVAVFVDLFRRPHERTEQAAASLDNLAACLTGLGEGTLQDPMSHS